MDIRAPTYNAFGTIDCEIKHPSFGWIPFTADKDDCEDMGREVHGRILAGEAGPVAPYVAPHPSAAQKAAEARAYLANTDWYVVRRYETGEPIPQDVTAKRAAARIAANG